MTSKHRVLFVDDEVSVTDGIRTNLRKAAFETLTANSGKEALQILAESPVDVVVSDERMPGMNGSDLLARVREEYPDTARMILSGQADLKAAVRAINDGQIFRFLLKPCGPEDLAESVQDALDSLQSRREFQVWKENQPLDTPNPEAVLERALAGISMAFQPIFTGGNGPVYAYEALVRLTDPEVPNPDRLFGLAEAVGRVPDVDYAIRAAIADRLEALPEGTLLFVNVHPDSLGDSRILSSDDCLAPYAKRVVLEITERSSIHESDMVASKIERLRELGYKIALDDLGAGYAGLSSFALMVPDVVKFDMGLIRGLHNDHTRARLIQSMAALCKEMDILTVAEGVETPEEMAAVLERGCDLIQGFLLARPEPFFIGEEGAK